MGSFLSLSEFVFFFFVKRLGIWSRLAQILISEEIRN